MKVLCFLVLDYIVALGKSNLMSNPRELQKYNNIYHALLWSLMDIPDQQLKTGLLMTGVGVC